MNTTPEDVLEFWFADPARWWKKDPAFDAEIGRRFATLRAEVDAGSHEEWRDTARGALAYVIALDQFSRNLFRGDPRAFASDERALAAAKAAVAAGFDGALTPPERGFLYMPFMHSEDLADQDRCLSLFAAYQPPGELGYVHAHRNIIVRFGRFPHRNEVLGRVSTPEELEFLKQPGSSF
jgi:uncharacterized protein (DUF924 family)